MAARESSGSSTMTPTPLILASGNAGKLREFHELLAPLGFDVRPQAEFAVPEVEETGLTFVENALLKAREASRVSGLPALADDSGLEVDALKGAPRSEEHTSELQSRPHL